MRLNLANNAGSKLLKDITATSTTFEVESAESFPVAPFLLTLARSEEIVKVTAVTGNALTVERAQEGTTAKAYLSGTDVWHNFTSGTYDALADKEYVDRKIEDIPQPDLTGYATKQEVSANATEISTVKQTVTTHLADGAAHGIGDKTALLTTEKTSIVAAVNELFTNANDGKSGIASVVGSPTTSADTFAQLKTHIQNAKNKAAMNLTAKGTSAVGTETLDALVTKIVSVSTGKKIASGITAAVGTSFNITGLGFAPSKVMYYMSPHQGDFYSAFGMANKDKDIAGADKGLCEAVYSSFRSGLNYSFRDANAVFGTNSVTGLPVDRVATASYKWIAME